MRPVGEGNASGHLIRHTSGRLIRTVSEIVNLVVKDNKAAEGNGNEAGTEKGECNHDSNLPGIVIGYLSVTGKVTENCIVQQSVSLAVGRAQLILLSEE